MQIFPGDDIPPNEIENCVDELHREGLIFTYNNNGKEYWHVTGWNHQKIDKPSVKYPSHEDENSSKGSRKVVERSAIIRLAFTPGR